ncbi:MAG: shikimate kinase, partial [Myxococcota bacterium]
LGKPPLADYYHRFALLQELTKIVLKRFASQILVAHTASAISPFSVTSFYDVGLRTGHVAHGDLVPFELKTE